ncbi:MAG: MFS transporter [Promethearchaeota archaeon]
MLTHEKLEKKLSRSNIKNVLKKIAKRRTNYPVFSIVYFIISLIEIYVIVYIPLFHFDVLNVNRLNLSLIQFFSYLVLFSFPAFGFFFDKYSIHKKIIIIIFSFLLFLGFLVFILFSQSLFSYSIFLILFLISQAVIRTGMSKLLLETPDKKSERNIIILINSSSSIGILFSSFLFRFCVQKIDSIHFWNIFFVVGWLISSPLLLIFLFMRKTLLKEPNQYPSKIIFRHQNNLEDFSPFFMIFTFLAYFFLWSDKLIAYPFSSYILSRFGKIGFIIYSDFYVIFTVLNITGFYLARKLLNKIDSKKNPGLIQNKKILQIIFYITLIYILNLISLLFSNFILLIFSYLIIYFLGGLFVVLYTSIFLQISRAGKNENLRYWIMLLSSNLASISFLPLGTYLSQYLSMEILIIIVICLTLLSFILINLSNLVIKCINFYHS